MRFKPYVDHGWQLCRIREGEKGPRYSGWNKRERAISAQEAVHLPGAGLMHAYSGTCALDVDDLERSRAYLHERGVDLDALLQAPDAVRINSGTANRAKLLYGLLTPLPTKKILSDDKQMLFELRCADAAGTGTVQDVLPPSVHPSGRQYKWHGNWRELPALPEALHALWRSFVTPASTHTHAPEDTAESSDQLPASSTALADARRILAQTDPDCDYDTWIKLGMALENDLGQVGWKLWRAWSAKGSKFPGDETLEQHWHSFGSAPSPVTLGTFKQQTIATRDDFEDITDEDLADPFDEARAENALKLWTLQEIQDRPWPTWIVRDVLPQAELSMVYGPSGAGKSFVVLDMALAIARGVPWWDHETRQGAVLWLAAEAFGSMKPRTRAYAQANALEAPAMYALPFYVVEQFSLADPAQITGLIAAVSELALRLVVVDTLAAASGGVNENSGEEMGAILDACRAIHYATGASVLLIHHSGKNTDLGARGWSGIKAAVQAELRVDYDLEGGSRALTATKQRDGQDGLAYGFALDEVLVGLDDREAPIMSASVRCLGKIEQQERVQGDGGGRRPKDAMQAKVFDAVMDNLSLVGQIPTSDYYALAHSVLAPPAEGDKDTRNRDARGILNKLLADRYFELREQGTVLVLPDTGDENE